MFGYIRPYKPELKVREFETYRAVYCGLCHALGKRYSFFMRMILSYDSTFLALMQIAMSKECTGFEKKRCPLSLVKKRNCCRLTDDVAFSADLAVILFYYKLKDTLQDASGIRKKMTAAILYPFVSVMHRKAVGSAPKLEECVIRYIGDQAAAERKSAGIDEAAHPTGELMSRVFLLALKGRTNPLAAERMGYFLGRWVYLIDAADDLKKDLKSGDYNPFVSAYGLKPGNETKEIKTRIIGQLNACLNEMAAAFELLEIKRFKPILANILYQGLPDMAEAVMAGRKMRPL